MKKLFIISNESVFEKEKKFYCDNIDLKSSPEGLNEEFEVNLLARKSSIRRSHEIKIENIKIFNSIFTFLSAIIKSAREKDSKYLLISISPYTFLASIIIKLLGKSPIVYLRSDGYAEYKIILGFFGQFIYHLMFSITSLISNFISCHEYILRGKKGKIVFPSQIDSEWLKETKEIGVKNFELLYIGRLRREKGIFSFLNLIKNKNNISLTIVGAERDTSYSINQSNVNLHKNENNKNKLIKFYDNHNIFVLPSFTEGYPMVLLEALARKRPVVVFEEIKHVVGNNKGIFVSKRNYTHFLETINYIKDNYQKIQAEMKQNQIPTNKNFIKEMGSLISNLN